MSLTNIKKGDTVIMHMFTGIAVSNPKVVSADKATITVIRGYDGSEIKFSRKTGKQIEPKPKNDRFANFITEDDGSFQPGNKSAGKKKAKKADDKKASKKAKSKPADEDEDEDEEPDEQPAKKAKKASKAEKSAKGKKKAKESEPEEDFDEDEYEEE